VSVLLLTINCLGRGVCEKAGILVEKLDLIKLIREGN